MALRDYLSSKIVTFLLPLAISGCGTGNVNNGSQYCGSDADCGIDQICSLSGQCIQEGSCAVDNDCGGNLICENGSCVGYSSEDPKQVLNDFADALKSGNLEKALSQVHPESKTLRDALSGKSLPEELTGFNYGLSLSELGNKLDDIDLTFKEDYDSYRDYTFPCGKYECLFKFKKDQNGQQKIERF